MNSLAIMTKEKAHTATDGMDFLELLASYPTATTENLQDSKHTQTLNNLSYMIGNDNLYFVKDDITINGELLSNHDGYIYTANTIATLVYDESFLPSGIVFYPTKTTQTTPLDPSPHRPKVYYTDTDKLQAFMIGSGQGDIIATDTLENAGMLFTLVDDYDMKNHTIIAPFDKGHYERMVCNLAIKRPIYATCPAKQESRLLKVFKHSDIKLISFMSEIADYVGDYSSWHDLLTNGLNDGEIRVTQLSNYIAWHDGELLDNPVKYMGGRFELYHDGLYFVRYEHDTESNQYSKQGYPIRICDPLFIKSSIRSKNSTDWGLLLEWKDKDHQAHEWAMPASLLQGDSKELRQILADMGLGIATSLKARNYLTAYLQSYDTPKRALSVNKTGWHDDSYVLPHCVIGGNDNEPIVLQTTAPLEHGYAIKGTLKEWQDNLAIPVAGQSRIAFAVACAFAGQLLELIGEKDGGGFHFVGNSSIGKSITLRIAGSVWGSDYIKSWNSTGNAMENILLLHNDGLACLDEINEADLRTIDRTLYMLGNGKPKERMSKTLVNRNAPKWRVNVLSTGEQTIENYLRLAGVTMKAGQLVRLPNIEANAGKGLGIFDSLTIADTPAKQAELLKANTNKYYGVAGIEWLNYLTQNKDTATNLVNDYIRAFLAQYPNLDGQAKRVANRFALVASAGELATKEGITGWQIGQAMTATKVCFDNWLDTHGMTGNHEQRQIIKQIQAFIHANGKSRFSEWEHDGYTSTMPNRVGFYRADNDSYYIYSSLFEKEICLPFNKKQVCETLNSMGLLIKNKNYQLFVKSTDRDKKGYFYCIKGDILTIEN